MRCDAKYKTGGLIIHRYLSKTWKSKFANILSPKKLRKCVFANVLSLQIHISHLQYTYT